VIADHIVRDVCASVAAGVHARLILAARPGRGGQFVFTIPRRLRIFFRFDRRLLRELPRLTWRSAREVSRAVLDRPDARPGMIVAIHTFGELVHWHPHLHALVTDGAFTPDGTFIALPEIAPEPFAALWQKLVFDLLLKHDKIDASVVEQMRTWRHSGLSVHHGVRLTEGDTAGLDRLAQYMLRCPFSLERLIKVTPAGQVLSRAEKRACRRFPRPHARRPDGSSPLGRPDQAHLARRSPALPPLRRPHEDRQRHQPRPARRHRQDPRAVRSVVSDPGPAAPVWSPD
jgi:hypothetical protein